MLPYLQLLACRLCRLLHHPRLLVMIIPSPKNGAHNVIHLLILYPRGWQCGQPSFLHAPLANRTRLPLKLVLDRGARASQPVLHPCAVLKEFQRQH